MANNITADTSLNINKLMAEKKIEKDSEFAKVLGISKQTLFNWRKRNTYDISLLTKVFTDINPTWLLTGEGSMLKAPINEVEIPETPPIEINSNGNIKYYYEMSATASNLEFLDNHGELGEPYRYLNIAGIRGECVAMNVTGESMYPTAKDKDIVIVSANETTDIIDGNIYMIISKDGHRMIKRLALDRESNLIKCISDNPDKELYPTFNIEPDMITRIFRVKGFLALTLF